MGENSTLKRMAPSLGRSGYGASSVAVTTCGAGRRGGAGRGAAGRGDIRLEQCSAA